MEDPVGQHISQSTALFDLHLQLGRSSVDTNSPINSYAITPPQLLSTIQSFGAGAPQNSTFQYSNCTGRKKALLIGINYIGQRGQLRGCINDVKNFSAFLNQNFGYPRESMVILADDQQDRLAQPTKQNILRAMHWLVKDAKPNDSLFFHYSGGSTLFSHISRIEVADQLTGHGGQTKDLDGDEEDEYDEVIYPVDFRVTGHIVDNDMHTIMVKPLQAGVRLTAIFDSCHSATALDLPYVYSTSGILREPNLAKEAGHALLGALSSYKKGNFSKGSSNMMAFYKKATTGYDTYNKNITAKSSSAGVIMFSGSTDDETT
jgi:hypothetical protein